MQGFQEEFLYWEKAVMLQENILKEVPHLNTIVI